MGSKAAFEASNNATSPTYARLLIRLSQCYDECGERRLAISILKDAVCVVERVGMAGSDVHTTALEMLASLCEGIDDSFMASQYLQTFLKMRKVAEEWDCN